MLERLKDLPPGVVGLEAVGQVSKEDYDQVVAPVFEEARREGRRLRFLYQIGSRFTGFTPGAAWEDAKIGLSSMRLLDGCALVTDVGWVRETARLAGFFMPCPVHTYPNAHRDDAVRWLASLPEGPGVSHRMLDSGVLVVEVEQALRPQDFDALSLTADSWIAAHGSIQGIVIHAREFPGWENVSGLIRHVRFVRDHQRHVKRVALAADAAVASIAPRIAEHFVRAEVKRFRYDEEPSAIAWAAEGAGAP